MIFSVCRHLNCRVDYFYIFLYGGFTFVDGQSLNVTNLFGMNFNRYSLMVNCFGEMKQNTFFGLENFSPCIPKSLAA